MPLGHTVSIREMLSNANADEEPTAPPSVAEPSTPTPTPAPVPPAPEPVPAPEAPPKPEGLSKFEAQLLKDVDTTGWSESQVSQFLKVRKNLEKGWHGSQAKYAEALRLAEALQQAGLTVDDLNETITRKKSGTNGATKAPEVSPQTQKVLKGIDRLIEEATDPAIKEQLRQSKSVIQEESERVVEERIQSRLKPMEEKVSRLESLASSYRAQESDAEIDALEDRDGYPASLVEKYRDQMRSYAQAYPQVSMKRILYMVAPPEEIESAIAPERPEKKAPSASKPTAKAPTVSSANEGEGDLEAFKSKKGPGGEWKTRELLKHYLGKVLGE